MTGYYVLKIKDENRYLCAVYDGYEAVNFPNASFYYGEEAAKAGLALYYNKFKNNSSVSLEIKPVILGETSLKSINIKQKNENEEILLDDFLALEPEKKRVPLTYEDMKERWRRGKPMVIELEALYSFASCTKNGILMGSEFYHFEDLLEHELRFINGDPCWKEV